MPDDPTSARDTPAGRPWSDTESKAVFALLGDRIIDASRRWSRSARRQRLQRDLYTVDGTVLSLAQVDALESVEGGDIRMHELAKALHVDPSTATRTVTPLVDLGLVDRQPDPDDRRYVILRCTPAGQAAARRIARERRELMHAVLEPMEPSRRLLLAELLEEYLALTDGYAPADGEA